MHTLIIDGHNHLHRARSGFTAGEHAVTFNALRSLRALVEQFPSNRVLFILEGTPKKRLELFGDYKANRRVEPGSEKERSLVDFRRQKDEFIDLVSRHVPVSVVRHPDHEADDVIYNLINVASRAVDFTVVSTDTDFTQLLNLFDNVKVYNPVKKAVIEWDKAVDYVSYKGLRGDGSDNVPGVPGFGEKKAMKLASDAHGIAIADRGILTAEERETFVRNLELIGFEDWDEPELMTSSSPTCDWDAVKAQLDAWEFKSITNDKAWSKFVKTFDPLFGG